MFIIRMIAIVSWSIIGTIYLLLLIVCLFNIIKNLFKKDKEDGTEITKAIKEIWED